MCALLHVVCALSGGVLCNCGQALNGYRFYAEACKLMKTALCWIAPVDVYDDGECKC